MNDKEKDIEVVIGDKSDLDFSDVADLVEALKPKTKNQKNSKIIIPGMKKKKDDNNKK